MFIIYCSIIILVLINSSKSIKLDMEATISLGKEVMESLSGFLGEGLNNRRSMAPVVDEDNITTLVRTAALCKDLQFCVPMWKFTEGYVIVLANSIQTILSGILEDSFKTFIFEGQLKLYLEIVRHILENTNEKISEGNEIYYWIDAMKNICSKFQEMSSIFITEEFQIDPNKINEVKKELNQKLTITTVLVELKYQTELCVEHNICLKSFEITKALNTLLQRFKTLSDEKVRQFIKYLYEALFDTAFYSYINEATAHELQVILNDMAYSKEVSTKDLLLIIQEIVQTRLNTITTTRDEKLFHDALLIHGILSDMDHIYSVHKSKPFAEFFENFINWTDSLDFQFDKDIRLVLRDIGEKLWAVPDNLLVKLTNEVKVFLELTVDPIPKNS
ncbi:uncharacterized protein LOC126777452 [Nymphalis io]|uniref:uncharacterized protein LOC126777452 n=1 Tax=Inachis io TaxID=171585 RepID=UPI00216906B7|nr:uncharacterized protein LOC126777452 [Nymphalis io]XP_050356427.1 uncharacterized protein LOC126777452 [Nymphalis io]